jgi:hypothetical protein
MTQRAVIELTERWRVLLRLQNDPRSLPHFQVSIRINEQRLLKRRFADKEILDTRNHLVAGAMI